MQDTTEGQEYINEVLRERAENDRGAIRKFWDFFTKEPYFSTRSVDELQEPFVQNREKILDIIEQGRGDEPWNLMSAHPNPENIGSAAHEAERKLQNVTELEKAYNALSDVSEQAEGEVQEAVSFALRNLEVAVGRYVDAAAEITDEAGVTPVDYADDRDGLTVMEALTDLTRQYAERYNATSDSPIFALLSMADVVTYVDEDGNEVDMDSDPEDVEGVVEPQVEWDEFNALDAGGPTSVLNALADVARENEESVRTVLEGQEFVQADLGKMFMQSSD